MVNFLIQVNEHGIPMTEVGYKTIDACNYNNWFYGRKEFNFILDTIDSGNMEGVPIGTIEYTEKKLGKVIKPINIPKELSKEEYTKRNIAYGNAETVKKFINEHGINEVFIKSNDRCKDFNYEIVSKNNIKNLRADKQYMCSEVITDIKSEYRAFVHNGNTLYVGMYYGEWEDYKIMPVEFIKKAVREYKDSPKSYTLDIGITENSEPFIIEVHNFMSCGLYGFSDYKVLLQMNINGYNYEIR